MNIQGWCDNNSFGNGSASMPGGHGGPGITIDDIIGALYKCKCEAQFWQNQAQTSQLMISPMDDEVVFYIVARRAFATDDAPCQTCSGLFTSVDQAWAHASNFNGAVVIPLRVDMDQLKAGGVPQTAQNEH